MLCYGECDSFIVMLDEFMVFYDVYMKYEYCKWVIGMVDLDGCIVYYFEKDGKIIN